MSQLKTLQDAIAGFKKTVKMKAAPSLTVAKHPTDAKLAAIKLRRNTLHPGTIVEVMKEAGFEPTSYVKGKKNHVWTVTVEQKDAFKAHVATFSPHSFRAHLAELRMKFPAGFAVTEAAAADLPDTELPVNADAALVDLITPTPTPEEPKE